MIFLISQKKFVTPNQNQLAKEVPIRGQNESIQKNARFFYPDQFDKTDLLNYQQIRLLSEALDKIGISSLKTPKFQISFITQI